MWDVIKSLIRKRKKPSRIRDENFHEFIGVSSREILMTPPPQLKKKIQTNINEEIKKLPENIDELNSMRNRVQTGKNVIKTFATRLSKTGYFIENLVNIYAEFDRLLNAINEKIQKTK